VGENGEANKEKEKIKSFFEQKQGARDRRLLTLPALTLDGTATVTNGTGWAATTAKHSTAPDHV
jgi:hypothetical protein